MKKSAKNHKKRKNFKGTPKKHSIILWWRERMTCVCTDISARRYLNTSFSKYISFNFFSCTFRFPLFFDNCRFFFNLILPKYPSFYSLFLAFIFRLFRQTRIFLQLGLVESVDLATGLCVTFSLKDNLCMLLFTDSKSVEAFRGGDYEKAAAQAAVGEHNAVWQGLYLAEHVYWVANFDSVESSAADVLFLFFAIFCSS